MGVPYVPMLLSTPPTKPAAAAAIADDTMDAGADDLFQLPDPIVPLYPVVTMPAVCLPCDDESQWIETDDEDDDASVSESAAVSPYAHAADVQLPLYTTPVRLVGYDATGQAADESQWGDDVSSDDDDSRDAEPPPPPSKIAMRQRTTSPTTTAAARAASIFPYDNGQVSPTLSTRGLFAPGSRDAFHQGGCLDASDRRGLVEAQGFESTDAVASNLSPAGDADIAAASVVTAMAGMPVVSARAATTPTTPSITSAESFVRLP